MKKLVIRLFTCLFTLGVAFSGFSFNTQTVKAAEKEITVFSWEDYMELTEDEDGDVDYDLIDKFEQESGIKVNYITFATNEDMYNELIKNPNACDLICPSEYMIMKMKEEGLIKGGYVCKNHACITGVEQELEHVFKKDVHGDIRCIYCEEKVE